MISFGQELFEFVTNSWGVVSWEFFYAYLKSFILGITLLSIKNLKK
jgi:hypothetical protein